MYTTDGGYSSAQFNNARLRQIVESLKLAIPAYLEAANADGIVVTGKSGLSMAFATLAHIDFPLVVVRKEGENSHGSKIEGTEGIDYKRLIVLDDFVSSGDTIRNIELALSERALGNEKAEPALIVGVLEWNRNREYRDDTTYDMVRMDDGRKVFVQGVEGYDSCSVPKFKEPKPANDAIVATPLTLKQMADTYATICY